MDVRFPSGRNPHLTLLHHQPKTLPCFYRPLIAYGFIEIFSWINDNMLRAAGYRRFESDGLIYFTKGLHKQSLVAECAASSAQSVGRKAVASAEEAVVFCQAASDQNLSALCCSDCSSRFSEASEIQVHGATSGGSSKRSSFESSSSASSYAVAYVEDEVSSAEELPIVFAHGVGMGLFPYLWFLISLAVTGQ